MHNTVQDNLSTQSVSPCESHCSSPLHWTRFRDEGGGVLVVGHGTRNASGVQQLLELVQQMNLFLAGCVRRADIGMRGQMRESSEKPFRGVPIEASFLELAEPSIEIGIQRLHDRGVKKILVVPILLFTAGHANEDIPQAVEPVASQLGLEIVGQSSALETHPQVLALSRLRFEQAILPLGPNPPPLALAMVGRGARDPLAIAKMLELTRLRVIETPVAWVETGFFAVAQPTVDELLDSASRSSLEVVVVQPHLLFEGELMDELRKKVALCQGNQPERRWIVGGTLGADLALAKTYLSLAELVLAKSGLKT